MQVSQQIFEKKEEKGTKHKKMTDVADGESLENLKEILFGHKHLDHCI